MLHRMEDVPSIFQRGSRVSQPSKAARNHGYRADMQHSPETDLRTSRAGDGLAQWNLSRTFAWLEREINARFTHFGLVSPEKKIIFFFLRNRLVDVVLRSTLEACD